MRGLTLDQSSATSLIVSSAQLVHGTLFFALVMPWATGETYDASSFLIQELLRRVEDDRVVLNTARLADCLPPYPEILHVWTFSELLTSS